jgi:hypothetical protein
MTIPGFGESAGGVSSGEVLSFVQHGGFQSVKQTIAFGELYLKFLLLQLFCENASTGNPVIR